MEFINLSSERKIYYGNVCIMNRREIYVSVCKRLMLEIFYRQPVNFSLLLFSIIFRIFVVFLGIVFLGEIKVIWYTCYG